MSQNKQTRPQYALVEFPRSHVECLVMNCKGNRAARRLLSLFRPVPRSGQLEAVESFRPQWLALVKSREADAELLAYRMAKVSNRPLGRICQPSHVTSNLWQYSDYSFSACCKAI